MKQRLIISIIFLQILMSCAAQSSKKSDKISQQIGYVSVCDTSLIYLYIPEQQDTLKGKGVIRLSLQSNSCNNIEIKSGEILFLSITKTRSDSKVLDYRYLITENLSNKEREILAFYEEKLYATFKMRGLCCENEKAYLDSKKFNFSFTFIVIPK